MEDAPHQARQAALEAALALAAALAEEEQVEPLTVHATAPGLRVTVRVVAVRKRERRQTRCERDILAVLADADGLPWTTNRVLSELARRGMGHGETTVRVTLARLSKPDGPVASSRRAPPGYRLRQAEAEAG
jgi:hypothetical protein